MDIVTEPFTVAAVGFNPSLFELERNISAAAEMIEEAASKGAKVIVLPELCISGSPYATLESWLTYMDTVPGKSTDAFAEIAKKHGCYITFGVAEVERETGQTYNSAALVGPGSTSTPGRRTHSSFLSALSRSRKPQQR